MLKRLLKQYNNEYRRISNEAKGDYHGIQNPIDVQYFTEKLHGWCEEGIIHL